MQNKRVVITGLGAITSTGKTVAEFWKNILEGNSGISEITHFDTTDYSTKFAGYINDYDPLNYFDRKEARKLDRFVQFGFIASKQAIEDSDFLNYASIDKDRVGVIIGSGIGGIETIEKQTKILSERGPKRITPFLIPMIIINMASAEVAIRYGLRGINKSQVTACATANHAIGDAFKEIQIGRADIMVAGGCEAAVTPLGFGGFCSLRALSSRNDDPKAASRPFDKDRDGFVMSEGAGVIILEELEHAEKRGAKIYAEIIGYGATCDAYHITAPEPNGTGGIKCMQMCLNDAGIKPEEVDYINVHGTSTPYNDKIETSVIKEVFKEHAEKLKISSTKSTTGHLLGAAAGIEAIASILAIKENKIPPTINYTTPDPECDLNYVPNKMIEHEVNTALSNALGFGGHNSTIAFKKYNN